METSAVVLSEPGRIALATVRLVEPGPADVVVDVDWSAISTGTERLLWSGEMPPFPGMGYPLVPGYEAVGRIVEAGPESGRLAGEWVFVPGSRGFDGVRGLFGAAGRRLVVAGDRVMPVDDGLADEGTMLALAATARHAIDPDAMPDLVIGHGVLGRLVARIAIAMGGAPPVVWETNPARRDGAAGYPVVDPATDDGGPYASVCDVSGDSGIIDKIVPKLAKGGEIVLAGFYKEKVAFDFPLAFIKEARFRIAAEWQPGDLADVDRLIGSDSLSLSGLITHRAPATDAEAAYATAFNDPSCLKMIIDWRSIA